MQVGCPWGWNIGITINYDESMLTWMSDHSHTTSALLFHAGILVKRQHLGVARSAENLCGELPFFFSAFTGILTISVRNITSQVNASLSHHCVLCLPQMTAVCWIWLHIHWWHRERGVSRASVAWCLASWNPGIHSPAAPKKVFTVLFSVCSFIY